VVVVATSGVDARSGCAVDALDLCERQNGGTLNCQKA
jgi:hypothetical protein